MVPSMPTAVLAGSPFSDFTVPAVALGVVVGGGALLTAALLVLNRVWGTVLAGVVGLAIMIFEIVETSVIGWDVWLHALGLSPTLGKGIPGFDIATLPAPLGVPLPLWLQPFYFLYGALMFALALRLWSHRTNVVPHGQRIAAALTA